MVGFSCHIHENQNGITQVHSICFRNLGQPIVGQETGNLPCVVTTTYAKFHDIENLLWMTFLGISNDLIQSTWIIFNHNLVSKF